MHCHSSSGQSSGLLFQKTMGAVTKAKWNHRRTIDALFHTGKQSKTLCLEKTTLRVRDYVQTLGLNAETKKDRHRAVGETFVLTFPLQKLSSRNFPLGRGSLNDLESQFGGFRLEVFDL